MNLLLDTHTLIWWLTEDVTLSDAAKDVIINPDNLVFVSAASAWEIAIKKSLGKLQCPDDLKQQMKRHRFRELAIDIKCALGIEYLPQHHKDPFDRILIAQAIQEHLTILTHDRIFKSYDVAIIES